MGAHGVGLMRDLEWYGGTAHGSFGELRQEACNYAKFADWNNLLNLLAVNHDGIADLANTTRPSGTSWYAPLHQVAWNGAPVEIAQQLIDYGAWRSLRNANGERPIDVARRRGYTHLLYVLTPDYKLDRRLFGGFVPEYKRTRTPSDLERMQIYFHAIINGRADFLVNKDGLRLPELEPMLENPGSKFWFAVPGMAGGFHYWLEFDEPDDLALVSESWCRLVGGSGERHRVTPKGACLTASGIV